MPVTSVTCKKNYNAPGSRHPPSNEPTDPGAVPPQHRAPAPTPRGPARPARSCFVALSTTGNAHQDVHLRPYRPPCLPDTSPQQPPQHCVLQPQPHEERPSTTDPRPDRYGPPGSCAPVNTR